MKTTTDSGIILDKEGATVKCASFWINSDDSDFDLFEKYHQAIKSIMPHSGFEYHKADNKDLAQFAEWLRLHTHLSLYLSIGKIFSRPAVRFGAMRKAERESDDNYAIAGSIGHYDTHTPDVYVREI